MSTVIPDEFQILNLSRSYVLSRALHICAKLNIADALENGPKSVDEIAIITKTIPTKLMRLLRFLSANKIFKQLSQQKFALTSLSQPLLTNSHNSVKDILLMVDDSWWQSLSNWELSFTEDKSSFEHTNGDSFFDYLENHPSKQQQVDKGMSRLSTFDNKVIVNAYDFSSYNNIIDIGCGLGGFAKEIYAQYPTKKVSLFDSQQVLKNITLDSNIFTTIAGDFFEKLPLNKDLYIYKGVLHDFDDEDAIKILTICKKCSPPNSKTLIVEQVLPETDGPHPNKTMDMVMMFLLNGRQRTIDEWQNICEKAGFKIKQIIETKSIFTIIELT
jgi:hypothetical protein